MSERIIDDINLDELMLQLPQDRKRFIDHSFEMSKYLLIKLKGYPQKFLANKLNKTEAEISKWLAGTHNFTLRTICKLEIALDIQLINPDIKQLVYSYFNVNENIATETAKIINMFPNNGEKKSAQTEGRIIFKGNIKIGL